MLITDGCNVNLYYISEVGDILTLPADIMTVVYVNGECQIITAFELPTILIIISSDPSCTRVRHMET